MPGGDLRETYTQACAVHSCKKNSLIMRCLPSDPSEGGSLTSLDLSMNFVGPTGCLAVIDVAAKAPMLHTLNLCDNQVNNQVVEYMAKMLQHHPALGTLNLARNPISHSGGKIVASFVQNNKTIRQVDVSATLVNPALCNRIKERAEANVLELEKTEVVADDGDNGSYASVAAVFDAIESNASEYPALAKLMNVVRRRQGKEPCV